MMNVDMKGNPRSTFSNADFVSRSVETESNARSYSRKFPIALKRAEGCRVEDVEGNVYLDFLCGAGSLILGHNDPIINQVMIDMINSKALLQSLDLITPVRDEFIQTLLQLLPDEFREHARIQFCSPSGTDAVDAALKLCKTATGRSSVIAFGGAYHGMGHGALSITGNLNAKNQVKDLMPEVHFFPYPYSYRCPFGLGGQEGTEAICAYFERTLKDPECGITKPAAVILETIQGEGGNIPAPIKFLQTIRRVTKELDIPMILDEIQCGCGRSGRFFAFEYADIVPDVLLISKGIGGSMPLSTIVFHEKLNVWKPAAHAGTFRGNQLAMRAGIEVMKRVSQPDFLKEVVEKGNMIKERLAEIKKTVSIIGDIRGKGLMIGCEFVNPKAEVDRLGSYPAAGDITKRIQHECFEKKLIIELGGRNGSVLRNLCALSVTRTDIAEMLDILEAAIRKVNVDVMQ